MPTTNSVIERQNRLVHEFASLPSWEDRYKRLIERGKQLPELPKELYDDKFKVRGCQSQVWLHAELTPEKRIRFFGDSDALIVKGLVALLLEAYSDGTAEEILGANVNFIKDLGFEGHLSPSRANGLYAMLKQIMLYATAFRALSK